LARDVAGKLGKYPFSDNQSDLAGAVLANANAAICH
jgi:hypothetical protein